MTDPTLPRLAPKEREILEVLSVEQGERYGLELVALSNGTISRGSIYVLLGRMKDRGLVESRVEPDAKVAGMPRQLYRISAYGARVLKLYRRLDALAGQILRPATA